jgi:hypothetical protein
MAILAAGVLLAAVPAARADHVVVLVTSNFTPAEFADRGAVGLLAPGRGPTVTRRETLDLLELDRLPHAACAERRPCPVEIFVELPPVRETHNVERYSIAIVGGGYRGLLVSENTRVPGLIAPSDVVRTVQALERGDQPPVRSRRDADAAGTLADLDRRLTEAHDARGWANVVLIASMVVLGGLALAFRSQQLGRAALLAAPSALLGALLLSALDLPSPALLAGLTVGGALAAARLPLAPVLAGFLVVYGAVLALWPEVNSLAIIGPHPDGGGRFYGVTNQVSTLLLVPALVAGALLGPLGLVPVAIAALILVGWSVIGADGGGALVLAAGFLVLALRLRGLPLTRRRVVSVAAATIAVALALVALDALSGGASHVTRAVGEGPLGLVGEFGHRLRVSFEGATSSWHAALVVVAGLAALAWLATRRPRVALLDAALVALAVSFVVNDTPTDVAAFGALSCGALYVSRRVGGVT